MTDTATSGSSVERGQVSYLDRSRPIKASFGFDGAAERRIDVLLWRPEPRAAPEASPDGPWPLVVYCHGTAGSPDNATYLVEALARCGYVVAAPNFPLTSTTAFTGVTAPNISDAGEQVRDVRFLIDQLIADPRLGPIINSGRIAVMGHSLGAITSWFLCFGEGTRDPRLRAAVMLGAGDPVAAAQQVDIGLSADAPMHGGIPALLVSAEKDLFTRMMGPPGTAYGRLGRPRYEVTIARGAHVGFNDGDVWPADHKNPDCLFFEEHSPGLQVPGGEERVPLIGPARQHEITIEAARAFLDSYLRQDPAALARLLAIPERFPDASLAHEK